MNLLNHLKYSMNTDQSYQQEKFMKFFTYQISLKIVFLRIKLFSTYSYTHQFNFEFGMKMWKFFFNNEQYHKNVQSFAN